MKKISLLLVLFSLSLFADDRYLDLVKPIITKIDNIKDNKSVIKNANLKVGITGIVVHVYKNNKKIIVSNAKVISSDNEKTVVEYFPFNDLEQDSIPNTNRGVNVGDVLVLSYMYDKSIVIAPTVETFNEVKKRFFHSSFLHPDILAANLKVKNEKLPTKEDIQSFLISQNIGTVFVVVNKKIYMLDSKTFNILRSFDISYELKEEVTMPFYSRVEKIGEELVSFDFSFDDEKNIYERHYKKLLGIK